LLWGEPVFRWVGGWGAGDGSGLEAGVTEDDGPSLGVNALRQRCERARSKMRTIPVVLGRLHV